MIEALALVALYSILLALAAPLGDKLDERARKHQLGWPR